MAVADVRRAQRFGDPVEEHQALAFFGREECQEGVQIHRLFVGDDSGTSSRTAQTPRLLRARLWPARPALDGDGQAGGIIGIGDDQPGDLASAFGGKLHAVADPVLGIRPTLVLGRQAPRARSPRRRTDPSCRRSTARARR